MQKHLPVERESVTRKMKIGDFKAYANVGLYEDGSPGELFLTVDKAGTFERGLCHALALVISLALQHGVPLEKISAKLTGLRFEPAGVTGSSEVPMVSSFCDYLGKWMTLRFLGKEK